MPSAERRACRPTWTIECTAAEIAETKRQNGAPRAGCRKLSMETGWTIECTGTERQTSEAGAGDIRRG